MSKAFIWWRVAQIGVDFVGIYAGFCFAYFFRVGFIFSSDFPFWLFAALSFLATVVWMGLLLFFKYYRLPFVSDADRMREIILPGLAGSVAIGMLIVLYFFPREILFSRLIGVIAFVWGWSFLLFSGMVIRWQVARLKKQEKYVYKSLVVGGNRTAKNLIANIQKDPFSPYKIVGVIDPNGLADKNMGVPILGKLDVLDQACDDMEITAIFQTDAFEHTINLLSLCEEKDIKFQLDPALRGILEQNIRIRKVGGHTLLSFVKRDFEGFKKLKFRIIDFILAKFFDID